MLNLLHYLFICISLISRSVLFAEADKLCANAACTEPISKARGIVPYVGDTANRLSFERGKEIIIISKSRNEKTYWGAIIDGNVGYVPSNLIEETKLYHSTDKLLVVSSDPSSNANNETSAEQTTHNASDEPNVDAAQQEGNKEIDSVVLVDSKSEEIHSNSKETLKSVEKDKVDNGLLENSHTQLHTDGTLSPTKSYDVIEGTTVYINSLDGMTPSTTAEVRLNPQSASIVQNENPMPENVSQENADENSRWQTPDGKRLSTDGELSTFGSDTASAEPAINTNEDDTDDDSDYGDDDDDDVDVNEDPDFLNGGKPNEFERGEKHLSNIGENTEIPAVPRQSDAIAENVSVESAENSKNPRESGSSPRESNESEEKEQSRSAKILNSATAEVNSVVESDDLGAKENSESDIPVSVNILGNNENHGIPVAEINEVQNEFDSSSQLARNQPNYPDPTESSRISDSDVTQGQTSDEANDQLRRILAESGKVSTFSLNPSEIGASDGEKGDEKSNFPEIGVSVAAGNTHPESTERNESEEQTRSVLNSVPAEVNSNMAAVSGEEENFGSDPENVNVEKNFQSTSDEESKIDDVDGKPEVDVVAGSSNIQDSVVADDALEENGETSEKEILYWFPIYSAGSSNTFVYLVVTAVTVLLFTLGHNFIEKKGKSGPLIAKINKLEQELFVTSKECLLLKDELSNARDKISLYENSSSDELIISLRTELEESKKARSELESSVEILQQELDSATEAGLDLNKMLSEVLTQRGGSESLLESVESLQAQLNSQQKTIDEMTKKLGDKNEENEALQTALDAANEKVEGLEEQLNEANSNSDAVLKENEAITQDLKSQINKLQIRMNQLNQSKGKELSKIKNSAEELQRKLAETSNALSLKEEECETIKMSVKQMETKGNVNWESMFDACKVQAELTKSQKSNEALMEELKREKDAKTVSDREMQRLNCELEKLKKACEEARQKENEAQKKLEVLSTYFKEKETQLQKELGLQEALWSRKKGDEETVYNMMKSMQEEVESYKSQNETLKKEILDQERVLKNQMASLEQKAHENWVAARQAERKLEESKHETAQLRNRLTLMEKNSNADVEGKSSHRSEELNGVEATSPVIHDTSSPLLFSPLPMDPNGSAILPHGFMPHPMFMPPPIGGFIPPPPFLPGDRRPPPLGRMSSPPLNGPFSPPPLPDYSYERMSSPPLSPRSRNYRSQNETDREHFRHKTPPYPRNWNDEHEMPGFIPISSQRDSKREHKGSKVSSGHSSSDSLDQSSKGSVRV